MTISRPSLPRAAVAKKIPAVLGTVTTPNPLDVSTTKEALEYFRAAGFDEVDTALLYQVGQTEATLGAPTATCSSFCLAMVALSAPASLKSCHNCVKWAQRIAIAGARAWRTPWESVYKPSHKVLGAQRCLRARGQVPKHKHGQIMVAPNPLPAMATCFDRSRQFEIHENRF